MNEFKKPEDCQRENDGNTQITGAPFLQNPVPIAIFVGSESGQESDPAANKPVQLPGQLSATAPNASCRSLNCPQEPGLPSKLDKIAEIGPPNENQGDRGPVSIASSQHSAAGRYLHENFWEKFNATYLVYLIVVFQGLVVYFESSLYSGFLLPISSEYAELLAVIVLFITFNFGITMAKAALTQTLSIYYALKLTSKRGFSLSGCVFLQCSTFEKYQYTKSLSLNSVSRRELEKATILFILLDLMNLLSFATSIGIYSEDLRSQGKSVKCLNLVEAGAMIDKEFPTLEYAMGTAKYSFSQALGDFRADYSNTNTNQNNYSQFLLPPILLDSVNNHQQITGNGQSVKITSDCICVNSADYAKFQLFTGLNYTIFAKLTEGYQAAIPQYGLTSHSLHLNDYIEIVSSLSGPRFCSGDQSSNMPICLTKMYDYYKAVVAIEVTSDGTSASISTTNTSLVENVAKGDLNWLYFAVTTVITNETQILPQQSTGIINPLLKWGTTDLEGISPSLINEGMEILFAHAIKVGIQRTFKPSGELCNSEVISSQYATLYIALPSYIFGQLMSAIIVLLSLIQMVVCAMWYREKAPIFPAIRLAKEKGYFSLMVNNCAVFENADDLCNSENFTIWQGLDKTVRVGEDMGTVSDPITGNIIISKPRLVRPLVNGRYYQ
ncbi:hypothetical protein HDV06_000469 [Boothiomyces sp. JEL0866]|nr:hypothetical protein HDV06_000469 [Boothiomyces sp. JEL0866]